MDNLDLDLGNYTLKDMERFFQLPVNKPYTASDVEYRETVIREQLLSSGHVDKKMKRQLIDFLTNAKQWLIVAKCQASIDKSAVFSSIPPVPKLDNSNYPFHVATVDRNSEIVERPPVEYVHTFPSDFQTGKLNPLNTRVVTKCLTVDTRFRENYYTTMCSDLQIQLPQKISKVVSMQLASMEIPVCFYGICEANGNNYLNMEVNYLDTSTNLLVNKSRTTVIPDGNYNGQDLVCVLNNIHAPMKTDGTLMYPKDIWSYVYFALDISEAGSGSGKMWIKTSLTDASNQRMKINSIKLDCTKNINGVIDNADLSQKLPWLLGFTQRIYSGATTYVGEAIVEPNPIRYIYLVIDDYNKSVNSNFLSAYENGVNNPNILARISIKGGYYCLIMDNDLNITTEPRRYFGPVDIYKLKVQLLDDRGRILDMNNSNYSFCLNFKAVYDL